MRDLLMDAARLAEIPEYMREELRDRVENRVLMCLAEAFHDELMKSRIGYQSPMLAPFGACLTPALSN